jgi:hypothetical protein
MPGLKVSQIVMTENISAHIIKVLMRILLTTYLKLIVLLSWKNTRAWLHHFACAFCGHIKLSNVLPEQLQGIHEFLPVLMRFVCWFDQWLAGSCPWVRNTRILGFCNLLMCPIPSLTNCGRMMKREKARRKLDTPYGIHSLTVKPLQSTYPCLVSCDKWYICIYKGSASNI